MNTPEPTPLQRQMGIVWQVEAEIVCDRIEAWMNQENGDDYSK